MERDKVLVITVAQVVVIHPALAVVPVVFLVRKPVVLDQQEVAEAVAALITRVF
jgi:hypothetical protein